MVDYQTPTLIFVSAFYIIIISYYLGENTFNFCKGKLFSSWIELFLELISLLIFLIIRYTGFSIDLEKITFEKNFYMFSLLVIVQLQFLNFLKSLYLIRARNKIYRRPTRNTFLKINSLISHSALIGLIFTWPYLCVFHSDFITVLLNFGATENIMIMVQVFILVGFFLPFLNVFILNTLMKSLELKYNSYEWKSIQNNNSDLLNKNAFIYQKEKIIKKLNNIGVEHQLDNSIIDKVNKQNAKPTDIPNSKIHLESDLKAPFINKNELEEEVKLHSDNIIQIHQENTLMRESRYKKENMESEEINTNSKNKEEVKKEQTLSVEHKFIQREGENQNENKCEEEAKNDQTLIVEHNFIQREGENHNENICKEEHKYDLFKTNLDFVKKITFEDINGEHVNENLKDFCENENLKEILKEKFILISIFCEFQANKTYVDYLLYLLVTFINTLIIIKNGETKHLENIIIFTISILMLLFYLILSCNLFIKFDEIIFNNKNNNAIKFFFLSKHNIFSINYFKDLKRINQGYERYSSLSNSNMTISCKSHLSNENDFKFEKFNSNIYRDRLNKLTISDEKFINNHLIFNLFFKMLKSFFERNEKYYIKQEYLLSTQLNINDIKEERKSFVNNLAKNNLNAKNPNGGSSNRNSNLNINYRSSNGNKDIIFVLQNISDSSASSFGNIKKRLNFSIKKFLNKIDDFEVRNFIEKKLRNDVLANTIADENFIINNNIADIDFKIEYLFSEYTLELLAFFDVRIKDVLEALDPIKNKNICKILAEKKKSDANYNCFFTHDNFLYFEIYDTNTDYFKNLKNFIEKYSLFMRENIINWNHTYIPLILGVFKINFMNFEKILVLYRHPCAFSIFKDFKYWINIALTDNNENVTISTTSQTQIIDVKLIEVIENISFHPNDFDEFYDILLRDLEFLKRMDFNPDYSFNIFVLNDFNKFLNESDSSNQGVSDNNVDIFANNYSNRCSVPNNRISVNSLYKNVNGLFNLNSNLLNKNVVTNNNTEAFTHINPNNEKDENKSFNNINHKNMLNEILSKLDKSELIRDENKKNNYDYKKLFGSETICSLDRINDYFNLYDRYTIKFYFSNILPFLKSQNQELIDKKNDKIRGKIKLISLFFILDSIKTNENRISENNQRYEFDPDNPLKINYALMKNKNLYKEKFENKYCRNTTPSSIKVSNLKNNLQSNSIENNRVTKEIEFKSSIKENI